MSKESEFSSYPRLIKRFTFRDEQTLRVNGGEPTDVTFGDNGVGSFNGTTSKVNYNLTLNGTYSVRIRCNPTSFAALMVLFDSRGTNFDGSGLVYLDTTTGSVVKSSGTSYVNGIATASTSVGVMNEVVVTGVTMLQGTGANLSLIGATFGNDFELLGTIDLFEIYEGTLTPSEVSNLYNDVWNKEQNFGTSTLIDFDSTNGVLELGDLNETFTQNNVDIVKTNRYAAKWNGVDSLIDTGSTLDGLVGDITILIWVNLYSEGGGNTGRLLSNDELELFITSSNELKFERDGGTNKTLGTIPLNKPTFIAITSTAAGSSVGYVVNDGVMTTSTAQACGTPVSSLVNLIIGNLVAGSRVTDGLIYKVKVVDQILDVTEITRASTSTLKEIG